MTPKVIRQAKVPDESNVALLELNFLPPNGGGPLGGRRLRHLTAASSWMPTFFGELGTSAIAAFQSVVLTVPKRQSNSAL